MSRFEQFLLSLYYYGSLPARRRRRAELERAGRAPVIVFYYHRIADDGAGAWTFPYALFERQVRWLARRFDMVSLAEAQRRLVSGASRRAAVALTFDDGYYENCRRALPLLVREGVPCTYFVSLRHVQTGEPFEHDLRRGRPLRPNTLKQLRDLARAGIDIGCHTRTHADLGQVRDLERLADEIVAAGEELAAAVGRPVRYLAFPFGQREHLCGEAFRLASAAGYLGVCSAYGGFNFPGDDPFHLQRIAADPVVLRLKNWASLDPRKLRVPRYQYRGAPAGQPLAEAVAP